MNIEVNIYDLTSIKNKMNNILDIYQQNYFNVYNQYSIINQNWNDGNSKKLYDKVLIEKKSYDKTYLEITSFIDILDFIIKSYSKFGTKIKINYEKINYSLDILIDTLNQNRIVLNKLSELSSYLDSSKIYIIEKIKNYLKENMQLFQDILQETKSILSEINEIEAKIKQKMEDCEISQFMGDNIYE